MHSDGSGFLPKINVSKKALCQLWKQNITAVICFFPFIFNNRFLNPNFKETISKTIMFEFKGTPDLFYKGSAPFTQGAIKFPEVIWSLWPGVTAWPSGHLFRVTQQLWHPQVLFSCTKAPGYQASSDPGHGSIHALKYQTRKDEFWNIFPSDLDTHFIFCKSITWLVSTVIEMLPPLVDFHQYCLEQINYLNVKIGNTTQVMKQELFDLSVWWNGIRNPRSAALV